MDGGNGAKTVVYNTKEDSKKKGEKKKYKRKKKERKRWKKYNNKKEEFSIIDHTNMSYPRILCVCMHV